MSWRYFFCVEFLGNNFSGSQIQSNCKYKTIQGELDTAFNIWYASYINNYCTELHSNTNFQPIKTMLASRVDAGVHAKQLSGHIDLPVQINNISLKQICKNLNGILAQKIRIYNFQLISNDFHARAGVQSRTYIYRIRCNTPFAYPLDALNIAHYHHNLDINTLNELMSPLLGQHDCTGLSRNYNYNVNPICNIIQCKWQHIHSPDDNLFELIIEADHFLYKMIRSIVGTSVDITRGHLPANSLYLALHEQNRDYLGHTAKASGLTLEQIKYKKYIN